MAKRKIKRKRKKFPVFLFAAFLVMVGMFSWFVWLFFQMNTALYEPGQLAGETIVVPEQTGKKWTVAPGIELWHVAEGSGPPILLISCGIETQGPSLAVPTDSSFGYTAHLYIPRGYSSAHPIDSITTDDFSEGMEQVVAALGIGAQLRDIEVIRQLLEQDQLTILAHGNGAFLASLYAAEFPDRVKQLILVAPGDAIRSPQPEGGLFESVRAQLSGDTLAAYEDWLRTYFDYGSIFRRSATDLLKHNEAFLRFYHIANQTTGTKGTRVGEIVFPGGWVHHAQHFSTGRSYDYRAFLGRVKARTLVIHGERDLQPQSIADQYVNSIPNAELVTISGAGHFPFHDNRSEFLRLVTDFLDKR